MRFRFLLPLILFFVISCDESSEKDKIDAFVASHSNIVCDDEGCRGTYVGPEYKFQSDVAHQFSNLMCDRVGAHLKKLYHSKKYRTVHMTEIEMSTKGMGSGNVEYKLSIPFLYAIDAEDATTAFDHAGGWGHAPELDARLSELRSTLLPGSSFEIRYLKTSEGLEEYFIQWKHKEIQ